tara:strand:- start:1269 stop:1595 length:327 start_codon:yes stop_codon:yes gene_type:complete
MGELLEEFVTQLADESSELDIKALLTEEELDDWELLVKAFTDIRITNIGDDLTKINKFYNLKRWQEVSIIALVKMFELMWAMNNKAQMEGLEETIGPLPKTDIGGMFG